MITHTKIIANPQYTICICSECNHHIPIHGLLTVNAETRFTCNKCGSILKVQTITEQTINIKIEVEKSTTLSGEFEFDMPAGYSAWDTVKESVPMKTDSSETKKAGGSHAVYTDKNNDVSWKCPYCDELNYELWLDDGDKISCTNCEAEVKVYVKSI